MKFEDYVKAVNKLLEENPNAANYETISSKDDEGNGFNRVCFGPSIGEFDGDDYTDRDNEDYSIDDNAVCIN